MNLTFKTISNKKYELFVPESASVKGLKDGLAAKYNFSSEQIKLIYHSKILQNDDHIRDLDISPDSYIVLHIQKNFSQLHKPPIVPIFSPQKSPHHSRALISEEFQAINNSQNNNIPALQSDSDDSPISSPKTPSIEPLPDLFTPVFDDPPNFEKNIAKLEGLGFPKNEAEYAYRSALYNLNRAADYLLSGYIPEPISCIQQKPNLNSNAGPNYTADQNEQSEDEMTDAFDYIETIEDTPETVKIDEIKQYLISHPDQISQFINALQQSNPEIAQIFKNNPERFVANLGLNPAKFDFSSLNEKSEYEKLMEQFTEEEQNAIHRLEKEGFDTMIILQVFDACDRNEEETLNCLRSM